MKGRMNMDLSTDGGGDDFLIARSDMLSDEFEAFCEDAQDYCGIEPIQLVECGHLNAGMAVRRASEFQARRVATAFALATGSTQSDC